MMVALATGTACTRTAAEAGEDLFHDPRGFSESRRNHFSCATCHATSEAPLTDRIYPGYNLHGVVARRAYWGGQAATLLDAVNTCIVYFQRGEPLDPASGPARQLYEYLVSLTPEGSDPTPLPLSIVENIVPVPLGDPQRGGEIYRRACQACHDEPGGDGGLADFTLPDDTAQYAEIFPGVPAGLVVIELVRHGRFFGVGGTMPFFSLETLTDEQIGDLLAFLGLPAE